MLKNSSVVASGYASVMQDHASEFVLVGFREIYDMRKLELLSNLKLHFLVVFLRQKEVL